MVKNLPAMWGTWVWSLEKGTATHFSILAWRIPWTEEPGRLQSMGSQRDKRLTGLSYFHFFDANSVFNFLRNYYFDIIPYKLSFLCRQHPGDKAVRWMKWLNSKSISYFRNRVNWMVSIGSLMVLAPWKKSCNKPRQYKKQRHYFTDKGQSS